MTVFKRGVRLSLRLAVALSVALCAATVASFCRETPNSLQNMVLMVSLDMYVCYMSHIHGHAS